MKKSWRKIIVDYVEYTWCLPGNCPCCSDGHILVHSKGALNFQVLYLDIYVWDLEIRPKTVELAIKFGLANGWTPKCKGSGFYLGYDNGFIALPHGVHFTSELNKN